MAEDQTKRTCTSGVSSAVEILAGRGSSRLASTLSGDHAVAAHLSPPRSEYVLSQSSVLSYLRTENQSLEGFCSDFLVQTALYLPKQGQRFKQLQPLRRTSRDRTLKDEGKQFFRGICSGSEDFLTCGTNSDAKDSASSSSQDSKEEFHLQKGTMLCSYCQGEHDLFCCPQFFCQLTNG